MSRKDYDVGYGKPPKSGQFKPGKSGNPKGRPRSRHINITRKDILQIVLEEAERTVQTKGGKLETKRAAIRMLVSQLANGHTPSLKYFIELVSLAEKAQPKEVADDRLELNKLSLSELKRYRELWEFHEQMLNKYGNS